MKSCGSLEIKDSEINISRIVQNLVGWKKTFKYMSGKSSAYAENMFVKPGYALCMKTDWKSLYEANIWLIRVENTIKVINITASIFLDVEKYNFILVQFTRDVVEKVILPTTNVVLLTGEKVMCDIMSDESYRKFLSWISTCNIAKPLEHPFDEKRFIEFLYSLYKFDNGKIDISSFKNIFASDHPDMPKEMIEDIVEKLRFGLNILSKDENRKEGL